MNALVLNIASGGKIKGDFWKQGRTPDRWHWAAARPSADSTAAGDRDGTLKYSAGIGREGKNKHWESSAGAELEDLPILCLPQTSSPLWASLLNPFSIAISCSLFVRLIKQDLIWGSSGEQRQCFVSSFLPFLLFSSFLITISIQNTSIFGG